MREEIRDFVGGLALAFGVVWILLAMLLLGCLVLQSSAAQNLSETESLVGVIAGSVVWVCGGVFVATYALAMMRGRYLVGLVAAVVPLLGIWVASRGPFVAADLHGPVPTLGLAVGLASVLVVVAGGLSWTLYEWRHPRRSPRYTSHSHRVPPLPA